MLVAPSFIVNTGIALWGRFWSFCSCTTIIIQISVRGSGELILLFAVELRVLVEVACMHCVIVESNGTFLSSYCRMHHIVLHCGAHNAACTLII